MHEFLNMGGYGAYVWSAYGLAALVLVANVVISRRAERRAWQHIARNLPDNRRDDTPQ